MLLQLLEKPAQLGQQHEKNSDTPGSGVCVWMLMVMTVLPRGVAGKNGKDHCAPKNM